MTVTNESLQDRIQKAITSQEWPTVTVLSSLLAVQDELGYIPDEAIEEVATFTRSTTNDVYNVASFYTTFRFTPPGEHVVEVCWGPTCHLHGAQRVLNDVMDGLGLSNEGDTEDGKVSLKLNTCLGACTQAPVISVDHRLTGRVTAESARKLVTDLRSGT